MVEGSEERRCVAKICSGIVRFLVAVAETLRVMEAIDGVLW
ncbi:MAG: hypothetical protein OXD49_06330 [Candidatus Poribacteria bacterium]|nr:hypothetical protein [Candidatus Poribacteria bacterium]